MPGCVRRLKQTRNAMHVILTSHQNKQGMQQVKGTTFMSRSNRVRRNGNARNTLPTRRLGSSELEITIVGFGAWAIGGGGWAFGWGPQDDTASLAAMRQALDLGVNWIDTAAIYGLGHSEEVVGRLLKELP